MLLILIVALIATTAFYRQAKRAGVHPGKAASVPFIAAGIVLAAAYLASLGIAKIAMAVGASEFTVSAVNLMLNLFMLLTYLALIGRNWRALVKAADVRTRG
ncbi:MAG: hypothetical protein ACTHK7_17260 [Aureliella sp.]